MSGNFDRVPVSPSPGLIFEASEGSGTLNVWASSKTVEGLENANILVSTRLDETGDLITLGVILPMDTIIPIHLQLGDRVFARSAGPEDGDGFINYSWVPR